MAQYACNLVMASWKVGAEEEETDEGCRAKVAALLVGAAAAVAAAAPMATRLRWWVAESPRGRREREVLPIMAERAVTLLRAASFAF